MKYFSIGIYQLHWFPHMRTIPILSQASSVHRSVHSFKASWQGLARDIIHAVPAWYSQPDLSMSCLSLLRGRESRNVTRNSHLPVLMTHLLFQNASQTTYVRGRSTSAGRL